MRIQTLVSSGRLDLIISRKRISASNPHQLLVLMVLATILLVLLSLIILKNQIRPIGKLAKAAEAFGKGQFINFKPGGSKEVRRAGVAFLAMRARIERQIKQRTQMLSGVSHDLRTPLTRLKLSLTLEKESQEVRDMLEDVNSMEAMLDEFLEFSKVSKKENADAEAQRPAAGLATSPTDERAWRGEQSRRAEAELLLHKGGDGNARYLLAVRYPAVAGRSSGCPT